MKTRRTWRTPEGSGRRSSLMVLALCAAWSCAPCARAAFGIPEMMRLMEERGLIVSSNSAADGALLGLIRSVDPSGRICQPDEARMCQSEWSGESGAASSNGVVSDFEAWPEGVSYLKITGLTAGGGKEILGHLRSLAGGSGVILDLRGSAGADLESVVALASPFYQAGVPLFRVESLSGAVLETRVAASEEPLACPLMALVDGETRCAPEILAALWSGREGVMLLGEPTRGDTRLRELLPLPDGRSVCLATRRLVPCSGADEFRGVRPDVEVIAGNGRATPLVHVPGHGRPLSEKSVQDRSLMMRVDGDPALRRGVDILLALRASQDHGQR